MCNIKPIDELKVSPIEIVNLSAKINNNLILDNISFEIPDKSITAILGPNGAGKSVLLKTINGLVPISKGKITFNSQETSEAIRKKQAMVFQSPTLLRRTVLGNMEFVNSINKNSNIIDLKVVDIGFVGDSILHEQNLPE